ncbi:MAG: MBL fold metallo-hydrolase [Actinobacteria bacterium]|nr:MBL fold metallo-hydrolase [Actinomycetota bacterium]
MGQEVESIETLDLELHGRPCSTAAFLLRGDANVLIETGPASSLPVLLPQLRARVERLDWILVTHIHLDHAGAVGALARHYREAKVGVHPRGVRHLADPSRLWAGAKAVYGVETERLWGALEPISPERLVPLADGERIELGDRLIEAIHTPGHARHHLALHDPASGDLFAGDALGIQHPAATVVRPTTPPSEFDLARALDSAERIRALGPERIWLTHFGRGQGGVEELCAAAAAALRRWSERAEALLAEGADEEAALVALREAAAEWEAAMPGEARATVEATNSVALNLAGIAQAAARRATADQGCQDEPRRTRWVKG